MEIIKTDSPREEAGKNLSKALRERSDTPILLMLSGGSAFTILGFTSLEVLGPHITLTVLDERYSTDPQVNNFAVLEQTDFFKTCMERGVKTISTKILEEESREMLRDRFEAALRDWKAQNKNGSVIATMGIGADGHTAGIFSGTQGIDFNGYAWVVGYSILHTENECTERITVTNTFLRDEVSATVVFAVGAHKKRFVDALRSTQCDAYILPCCILREMAMVSVVTDQ